MTHAVQKSLRDFCSLQLVTIRVNSAIDEFGSRNLAEIMSQSQQHERVWVTRIGPEAGRSVQHLHGMGPDVPFRMKSRILFQSYELLQLPEPESQLIHLSDRFKKAGRLAGFQERLLHLQLDALGGQMGQIERSADCNRGRRDPESESGCELGST